MKYLVMVQGSQADYDAQSGTGNATSPAWDEKAMQEMFAYMGSINDDLAESGELVTAYGLTEPAQGRAHPRQPAGGVGGRWSRTGRTARRRSCSPGSGSSNARAWRG